jgi:acyl-[acyl-carrier-protein]-phospholipid O-acyltransferase / long-chain-fatty-acid--[acyl-carrier-protein] ligase
MSELPKPLSSSSLPTKGCLLLPNRWEISDGEQCRRCLPGRELHLLVPQGHGLPEGVESWAATAGYHLHAVAMDSVESVENVVLPLVEAGHWVMPVYPQVAVRTASVHAVPASLLRVLTSLRLPLVPVYFDRPEETHLVADREKNKPVPLVGGSTSGGGDDAMAFVWRLWLDAGEICLRNRTFHGGHMARYALSGLKRVGAGRKIIDGMDDSQLGFDKLLAVAMALVPVIKERTKNKRVGIILPPGRGAYVANLAVMLAGKVPVNMNFTAARASVQSAYRQASLDLTLSADKVVRALMDFPWPPNRELLLLDQILPSMVGKIKKNYLLSKLMPRGLLASILGLPKEGGDDEAVLLFTSGSSGEPKGVVLTHRNILGNIAQFGSRINLVQGEDSILGCLPFFHSFGSTVALWFPLIEGFDVVTYPKPAEVVKLAELIGKYRVSMLLATPTFLRGYLRRVNAEQLLPLKLVITGAEKLPVSLAQQFEMRFGKKVMEGYGLTETSPVSNVNLTNPVPVGNEEIIPACKPGSVGQLMPGLSLRMSDPETGQPRTLLEGGMISFRGINVFNGYLGNPTKTAEVIQDGWFRTGDLGRFDDEGFLHIEGRVSRFSKLAGEMVPHETVEEKIIDALGWHGDDTRRIAIMGVPDEDRGEALVLLCAGALTQGVDAFLLQLRMELLAQGVPALWIPKKLVPVEEIPHLASGKLDLGMCQKLAAGS